MPDVFISYSRRNLEFVQQLVRALQEKDKDPWFDQQKEPLSGIAAGAPWWKQIQYGIESVDSFLFVITPNSISSPYCHAEINYAREQGKRLVPVLYCGWISENETRKAIDSAIDAIPETDEIPDGVTSSILNLKNLIRANWLAISEIQYVVFSSSIPFEQSITLLIQALDLDLAWVKMYSQLTQAAELWAANNFSDAYRWSDERLKPVYEMIGRRKPELNSRVLTFIEPEQERLMRKLNALETSHHERLKIGERLGIIGDTRKGIGVRMVRHNEVSFEMPEIDFCQVKTESWPRLKIGDKAVKIKPFSIARYMITHRQYQAFKDAPGGFANLQWWQGIPEESQLQKLEKARNQFENAPRDTVSWYQAVAFCRWLDTLYTQLGWKANPNHQIRLPTEWEWLWAAQNGAEARQYAWGQWDGKARTNTSESGINDQSVAVGMYPAGAANCGALDMAGNLWEWCFTNYKDITVEIGLYSREWRLVHSPDPKVIRGGCFQRDRSYASSLFRGNAKPFDNYLAHGFRVVLGPPI